MTAKTYRRALAALAATVTTLPSVTAQQFTAAGNPGQASGAVQSEGKDAGTFRRVASFPVFLNTDVEDETVAEIVAAADGGNLLVYTDSATENLGFVDISDPSNPLPGGVVALPGGPTSVAVLGQYALVAVNTSDDFVNTSGELDVVDVYTRQIVAAIQLGGQPDCVAVSPDGRYAVVAIENERDEDLGNGEPPQLPAGFVVIVDLVGGPAQWTTRTVDLVGVADLFPEDPEPEFVDISPANVAAVTLQENNHVVLIRLASGKVVADFPAGSVDLTRVDVEENDLIEQDGTLLGVPREPDAVAWTSNITLATADEGDLFGGSRGFTTWFPAGFTLHEAGNTVEHAVARIGHYPEDRSENKGSEPEGIEFARFGKDRLLFVGTERSNAVLVYRLLPSPILGNSNPTLVQILPTGVGPEGLLAIPERDLFVVACETDDRDAVIRSTVMIYERSSAVTYPTVESADRPGTGVPIPWAALSGLAADPIDGDTVHAVHDSYYQESRVYSMDASVSPARIEDELVLSDANGVLLAALNGLLAQLPATATDDFDPAAIVDADGTVNLDPEGIAVDADGDFWLASEGAGNLVAGVSDPSQPFEAPNLLVEVDRQTGVIKDAVLLPLATTLDQLRFGFEGVAVVDERIYVAFQRAWTAAGDPSDRARIGCYDRSSGSWSFAYYPLEAPSSPNGGWVGLSELTHLGGDDFAVLERDNQGGPDGTVKLVTRFSISGVTFQDESAAGAFDVLAKTVVSDLVAEDAFAVTGGLLPEKLEGMTVLQDGTALIVNDNDGVEDNNGETQLLRLADLFQ